MTPPHKEKGTIDDPIVIPRPQLPSGWKKLNLNDDQKKIADRRMWMPVSLLVTGVMPPGMSDALAGSGRRPPM